MADTSGHSLCTLRVYLRTDVSVEVRFAPHATPFSAFDAEWRDLAEQKVKELASVSGMWCMVPGVKTRGLTFPFLPAACGGTAPAVHTRQVLHRCHDVLPPSGAPAHRFCGVRS